MKVLVVEDDFMIADMTARFLLESGFRLSGTARDTAEALDIARRDPPDVAVIDLHLSNGETGVDVAGRLREMSDVGILYVTGETKRQENVLNVGHACLLKPYLPADLLRALAAVSDMVATGNPPVSIPPGLQILEHWGTHR